MSDLLSKMESDEFTKEVYARYKRAKDAQSEWRDVAKSDYNFVAGHQWDDKDIAKLESEGRPIITFNRCNTIVSAILGMEANQRQETTFIPREHSDTGISDATDAITDWAREYAGIATEEAQAFEDMLTCGLGWTYSCMDYDIDLDGKIIQERIDPVEMFYDPSAIKRNLSDARWVGRARRMSREEITERWPDAELKTENPEALDDVQFLTWNNPADRYKDDDNPSPNKAGYTIIHIQWYEASPIYRAQDPTTGKLIELTVDEYKEVKEMLTMGGAKVIKQQKRTFHQAFIGGGVLLERSLCPSDTRFTYNAITGKRDHVHGSFYGIVRLMKDPQKWANKFFSQVLDIINSNSKGGIIAEEGAFADQRKAEEDWAKSDSIIYVRAGAIAAGKIQNKPIAPYPQGIDRLMHFAIDSLYQVTGVNMEFLGLADREQANVLEENRKRSGYTILAPYFDSLRNYRKSSGILLLEMIQKYMPEERMKEVLAPEYHNYIQAIKTLDLKSINVVVTESPQSDNNKAITWMMLNQIIPVLLKMNIPIPPEVLEYSPLPAPLVEKWKQLLAGQQQDPMKQIQQQMGQQKGRAEIQETQSKAQLNQAKALNEQMQAMRPQNTIGGM